MKKNLLFFMMGFLIALSFVYIKTTYGAQEKSTTIKGLLNLETSSFTIPDNGVISSRATATLSPTTSFVIITCQDPDNCDIFMDNTAGVQGDYVSIVSDVGSDTFLPDLGANFGVGSGISLIHAGTRWIYATEP